LNRPTFSKRRLEGTKGQHISTYISSRTKSIGCSSSSSSSDLRFHATGSKGTWLAFGPVCNVVRRRAFAIRNYGRVNPNPNCGGWSKKSPKVCTTSAPSHGLDGPDWQPVYIFENKAATCIYLQKLQVAGRGGNNRKYALADIKADIASAYSCERASSPLGGAPQPTHPARAGPPPPTQARARTPMGSAVRRRQQQRQ
jgi:hypothetical protein